MGRTVQTSFRPPPKIQSHKQWAGKDLNLRRQSRQIYSLVRLTTSLPTQYISGGKLKTGLSPRSVLRLQFKTFDAEKLPGEGSNFK